MMVQVCGSPSAGFRLTGGSVDRLESTVEGALAFANQDFLKSKMTSVTAVARPSLDQFEGIDH